MIQKKRRRTKNVEKGEKWNNFQITAKTKKSLEIIESYEPIEKKYSESLDDLIENKPIKKIILKNNIDSDINFQYIKSFPKVKNINYIKEALNTNHFKSLFKEERKNPFKLIIKVMISFYLKWNL